VQEDGCMTGMRAATGNVRFYPEKRPSQKIAVEIGLAAATDQQHNTARFLADELADLGASMVKHGPFRLRRPRNMAGIPRRYQGARRPRKVGAG
jgi:hypothetical protein